MRPEFSIRAAVLVAWSILSAGKPVDAQQISLRALVTPSTVIIKDGHPVTFAVHGFIDFKSLAELFPYIEAQAKRWRLSSAEAEAQAHLPRLLLRPEQCPARRQVLQAPSIRSWVVGSEAGPAQALE